VVHSRLLGDALDGCWWRGRWLNIFQDVVDGATNLVLDLAGRVPADVDKFAGLFDDVLDFEAFVGAGAVRESLGGIEKETGETCAEASIVEGCHLRWFGLMLVWVVMV